MPQPARTIRMTARLTSQGSGIASIFDNDLRQYVLILKLDRLGKLRSSDNPNTNSL
jgi:hypothetical protein